MGTFALRLTGLVTVVADGAWEDSPQWFCALAPDLVNPTDADDYVARKLPENHLCFLRMQRQPQAAPPLPRPAVGLAGGIPSKDEILYLNRHRLSFRFEGAPEPSTLRTSYSPALAQCEETNLDWLVEKELTEDCANVIGLSQIVPGAAVDPEMLEPQPPKSVRAQLLLGEVGELRAEAPGEAVRWRFPAFGGNVAYLRSVSKAFRWEVRNVQAVALVLEPLDAPGAPATEIKLAIGTHEIVEATFANVCRDNPLEWRLTTEARDDLDFQYHFDLLTESWKGKLLGRVPYPKVCVTPGYAASGTNCNPLNGGGGGGGFTAKLANLRGKRD